MKKRLAWTGILTIIGMVGIFAFNYYLLINADTPSEERDRNFISIVFVESLMIFLIIFSIINTFFTIHPDYTSLVYQHKKLNPNIPREYYKDTTLEDRKSKDEIDKAVDNVVNSIEKDQDDKDDYNRRRENSS